VRVRRKGGPSGRTLKQGAGRYARPQATHHLCSTQWLTPVARVAVDLLQHAGAGRRVRRGCVRDRPLAGAPRGLSPGPAAPPSPVSARASRARRPCVPGFPLRHAMLSRVTNRTKGRPRRYIKEGFSASKCLRAQAARGAQVIGAPLAAGLLFMDGVAGRHGWTWLFLIEGLITILFGVAVLLFLPRKPATLRVLQPAERTWLQGRHEHADAHARAQTKSSGSFWAGLVSWRLWYLGICWFLVRTPLTKSGPFHPGFSHTSFFWGGGGRRAAGMLVGVRPCARTGPLHAGYASDALLRRAADAPVRAGGDRHLRHPVLDAAAAGRAADAQLRWQEPEHAHQQREGERAPARPTPAAAPVPCAVTAGVTAAAAGMPAADARRAARRTSKAPRSPGCRSRCLRPRPRS